MEFLREIIHKTVIDYVIKNKNRDIFEILSKARKITRVFERSLQNVFK